MAARTPLLLEHALLVEQAVDVHQLPGFGDGEVSVQDGAAQLAAHLVAPMPGDRVLDACAAPGGKTCHLAELQPALGELVAVDVSAARLRKVADNLQRLQLQAELIAADAAQPQAWWDGRPFDRILLDVPCSATGVIRRHPDIKLLRRASDIGPLVERQSQLLDKLWHCLKPGGRLVYASCSALQAETSGVIAAFLQRCPQAVDVTAVLLGKLCAGHRVCARGGCAIAAGTLSMDGFYYACLEKTKG
jgi:16S rRNA (cytosine967-C5)-methyltransferase